MGPVTLRTARLVLRPFELTDVDDVFAYARDPVWGRFLPVPSPYEYKHAAEYVARSVLTSWSTAPVFAMCLDGKVVGAINIGIHARNATAEMGYSISQEHWGKGLVAEAVSKGMTWTFEAFDLAKITAETDVANGQSWRVMEKLGMTREGVLRSERPSDAHPGSRQDVVVYSILREEHNQCANRDVP